MIRPVTLYYAATILFLILDFVLGVNVRVAFLEPFPTARMAYYLIVAGIAYFSWVRGVTSLKESKISKRDEWW